MSRECDIRRSKRDNLLAEMSKLLVGSNTIDADGLQEELDNYELGIFSERRAKRELQLNF